MSMKFSVLASGSTGNSLYVESGEHSFLVDAGLSGKKMTELLNKIDKRPEDLSGIFVTHEHSDHIKGLGILARKYKLPIYANANTWRAMDGLIGEIPTDLKFEFVTTKDYTSEKKTKDIILSLVLSTFIFITTTEKSSLDLQFLLYIKPHSLMIRFPSINPKRSIHLLHQDQPHQLVWEGHFRER